MAKASGNLVCWMLAGVLSLATFPLSTRAATLLGVESDTGKLYEISTENASLSLIGNTGIRELCSLDVSPDGILYGFNVGSEAVLFQIDPKTAQTTPVGPLGLFAGMVEGGLAFAPEDGTAYGLNLGTETNAQLVRIDILTGEATPVGALSGATNDINGLAWRSRDRMLVGLNRISNSLVAIDPLTAACSVITQLNTVVGGVGGMAALGDTGYFSTAGPCITKQPDGQQGTPGSNELYSFNLYSGEYTFIGRFPTDPAASCSGEVILGWGISGLALVPDSPATPPPRLSIAPLPNAQVLITWKRNPDGYALETASNLAAAAWAPVTNGVSSCGNNFSVVVDLQSCQRLFRLHKL